MIQLLKRLSPARYELRILIRYFLFLFWRRPIYSLQTLPKYKNNKYQHFVEKIRKNGFYLIENVVNSKNCNKLLELYDDIIENKSNEFSKYSDYKGLCRVSGIEKIKYIDRFLKIKIDPFAKSYVGKKAIRYKTMIEYKSSKGETIPNNEPHFDDWRSRLKAFIYLKDVTYKDGPLSIYNLNDFNSEEYLSSVADFVMNGNKGNFGFLGAGRKKNFNSLNKKIQLTGKKGTLIFLDTRFLHSGTENPGHERWLLGASWDIR